MVTFLVGSDVSVSDLYDMEWGEAWEQSVYLGAHLIYVPRHRACACM